LVVVVVMYLCALGDNARFHFQLGGMVVVVPFLKAADTGDKNNRKNSYKSKRKYSLE
jgi:hypothetical protein